MAVFNAAKKEIDIKIVYYGPALCGKTTNVQCIHKKLAPEQRGDMMSLATKDDRTLFFDFLPIELGNIKGFKTRFHIYTVPGQVYYSLTRRAVLTGVDGVIFVADSQKNKMEENIESLNDLKENLDYYKKDLTEIPFIIQYNKRDLPGVLTIKEMNSDINVLDVPCFESSAIKGTGVLETLTECCKMVLKQMNKPRHSTSIQASTKKNPKKEGGEENSSEPVIKITNESPAEPQETVSTGMKYREGFSPVGSDGLDTPDLSADITISDGNKDYETAIPSINLEDENGNISETEITLESSEESEPEISFEQSKEMGTPSSPDQTSSMGISMGGGFEIISCGQPEKNSDTSIKVPVVFKIDELNRECSVNICISFDDFKLKK